MKKQKVLKPYFVFLLLFTFSMLVFGCWDKSESKFQAEKVEGRQLMEESSEHANEVEVARVDTPGSEVVQFVSPVWHKELAGALYLVVK